MTEGAGRVITDENGLYVAEVTAGKRLCVDINDRVRGIIHEYLLNNGSDEMAIDGGVGTVFSWTPGAVFDVTGVSLNLLLEDATIYFGDHWGGISTLANGILIEIRADSVDYTIFNLCRTRELWQLSRPGCFEVYSATPDCCNGGISLNGFIFRKSSGDYVRATIRDNLGGLSHQSMVFKGRKLE